MKNYLHNYKGYGIHDSVCRIHIKEIDDEIWIGFEDIGEGTSVTNASEQLATEILEKENLTHEKCRFFEWYPSHQGHLHEITYTWEENRAYLPEWKFFSMEEDNPFLEHYKL